MTTLATRPVADPDQLALIADDLTPFGRPLADAFRDACRADAAAHDGMVHPSRVSSLLREAVGDFDPRRFSAMWAPACGRNGYLEKTDILADIDPEVSKGNGNKQVRLRRWRVTDDDFGWTEFALSDCPSGCKVYRHRDGLAPDRVIHNSNYGCRRGAL